VEVQNHPIVYSREPSTLRSAKTGGYFSADFFTRQQGGGAAGTPTRRTPRLPWPGRPARRPSLEALMAQTANRTPDPGTGGAGRPAAIVRYNVYRVVLLVIALGLGYLAGLRGLLLIVAALLASGLASYFLLTRQRLEMAAALGSVLGVARRRTAARAVREDAAAAAWHAGAADGSAAPFPPRPAGPGPGPASAGERSGAGRRPAGLS
jgi:hypothetical protein